MFTVRIAGVAISLESCTPKFLDVDRVALHIVWGKVSWCKTKGVLHGEFSVCGS